MQNLLDVTPEIKPIPPPLNMQNLLMMQQLRTMQPQLQQLRTMPPPRLQQLNDEMDIANMGVLQQLNNGDQLGLQELFNCKGYKKFVPGLQQLNYEKDYAKLGGTLQQLNGDDEMAMADMGLQQLSTTGVFNEAKDAMDLQQLAQYAMINGKRTKITRAMRCYKLGYVTLI